MLAVLGQNIYVKYTDKKVSANSVDPNQTAPIGAVWLGSMLFATLSVPYF